MKSFENPDELAAVLRDLSEAGLVDIVVCEGGEASFTLSAAITKARPGAPCVRMIWYQPPLKSSLSPGLPGAYHDGNVEQRVALASRRERL